MTKLKEDSIRQAVRVSYSKIAEGQQSSCCEPNASACCSPDSTRMGYTSLDLKNVPAGADMGLGCGNPRAIASLVKGEAVLDLGSGGGFDCFLAAPEVGPSGKVIGVDMTPSMISKARANLEKTNFSNVEFRLGEIEHLPVADNSIDVIISNCVINLSPDKAQVFKDAYRVLKPGGRLAISDVVTSAVLPQQIKEDLALHSACVAGASLISDLEKYMREAGFEQISIIPKDESRSFIKDWAPGRNVEDYVVSASIEARKKM